MTLFNPLIDSLVKTLGGFDEKSKREDELARQKAEKILAEAKRLARAEMDTGAFAEGYYVKKLGRAKYEVRNDIPYAQYVEEGRRAGKRPPSEALRGWAERRGMLNGNTTRDRGTLYVLARAIGQRGIEGKHILERAKKNLNY